MNGPAQNIRSITLDMNMSFVIAGYVVMWVCVIGYWVYVHRSLRAARARYEQVTIAPRNP